MHVACISNTIGGVGGEGEANVNSPGLLRYTSAVGLAKYCEREMSEVEFEDALEYKTFEHKIHRLQIK